MSPDQFVRHFAAHIFDGEAASFARDLRMHHHLEEQIAQLLAQIRVIACPNRIGDFVGLFEQARDQRLMRLFAIPRAALRGANRATISQSFAN